MKQVHSEAAGDEHNVEAKSSSMQNNLQNQYIIMYKKCIVILLNNLIVTIGLLTEGFIVNIKRGRLI